MPSLPFRGMPHGTLCAIAFAIATMCVTGCATSSPSSALSPSIRMAEPESVSSPTIPVVRDGRYTLVELMPDDGQRDLMRQVIDLTIPAAAHATVGDALHYVLRHSGYRLCDAHADTTAVLYTLPLPAAHEHLGPITLREALQLLAGPRWTLHVDDDTREVCFAPLPDNHPAPAASSPPLPDEPMPPMDVDPINDPVGEAK